MKEMMLGIAAALALAFTAGAADAKGPGGSHDHGRVHGHSHGSYRPYYREHGRRYGSSYYFPGRHHNHWHRRIWDSRFNRWHYWDADLRLYFYYNAGLGGYYPVR
jgi:hypothetical protein